MLQKNDVICAFGDSITAMGYWEGEVFQNTAPYGVPVYNCGVPGDTCHGSIIRIENDCLCYHPTIVTVMFGANDMEHWLNPNDEKLKEKTENLFQMYKENLEKIIGIFLSKNIRVILMTPPPFVEGDCFDTFDNKCNNRLTMCAEYVKKMAEKYQLECIDLNGIMSNLPNIHEYFNADRVHPTHKGNRVIAGEVLRRLGFDYHPSIENEYDFSEINMKRMTLEGWHKKMMYSKHVLIEKYCFEKGITMTYEQKVERLNNQAVNQNDYIVSSIHDYLENYDNMQNIQNDIAKKNLEMVAYYTDQKANP